jgi:hypothetical protein
VSLSVAMDGVVSVLAKDAALLSFKGLSLASLPAQIAEFIVKSEETDEVIDHTKLPLILAYTRPGKPDIRTPQMHHSKIVIDVFAPTDYIARQMADEMFKVLHNGDTSTTSETVSGCRYAYGTSFMTGIQGIKGYKMYFDVLHYIG